MRIDLNSPLPDVKLDANRKPLYSHRSYKLLIIFIYGHDYHRQPTNNLFTKLTLFTLNWTNLFVILAAVVLCFVRRLRKLRRDGFISVLIDVMVIFTGGGRLNGFSRANSISILLTAQSLRQLAEINPLIYIPPMLRREENYIVDLLRYIFIQFCRSLCTVEYVLNMLICFVGENWVMISIMVVLIPF